MIQSKTALFFLKTFLQIILLLVSVFLIAEGLWGNPFAPKNLTTQFVWVHYRGLLVLILLFVGNLFCMSCPFIFIRNALRVFHTPKKIWPEKWQNKWMAIVLFAFVLFCYEYFHLWGSPLLTAWVIVAYFLLAIAVDLTFKKASFCKYLCPIGQFNFLSSSISPTTVKAKSLSVCESCTTFECLKGVEKDGNAIKRGCETSLFIPKKKRNLDCTFCLDCIDACPHDNIQVALITPGEELLESEASRSGIGALLKKKDWLFLIVVFTFGALLNAFAMTSAAGDLFTLLAEIFGITHPALFLLVLFALFLIALPLLLISKRSTALIPTLLPMGFFIWTAHYSFHFLTGLFAFVPLLFKIQIPNSWMGLPTHMVTPIQYGFLLLGFLGSLSLVWVKSNEEKSARLKWSATHVILFFLSLWIMSLPMEMRGTFVGIAP